MWVIINIEVECEHDDNGSDCNITNISNIYTFKTKLAAKQFLTKSKKTYWAWVENLYKYIDEFVERFTEEAIGNIQDEGWRQYMKPTHNRGSSLKKQFRQYLIRNDGIELDNYTYPKRPICLTGGNVFIVEIKSGD